MASKPIEPKDTNPTNNTNPFAGIINPQQLQTGSIDFNGIRKTFNEWNPTSDWGKMMKGTYMMNTLQGAQDMQQAQSMAATNAGLQSLMMQNAADLELRNKGALMKAEELSATNLMGQQFNYQNRFAQDEYNRDIGKMGFEKGVQTALMQVKGDQDRATSAVQGYETRLGYKEQGEQTRLTQAQANVEKQQQANLANQIAKDQMAFGSGIKKDESAFASGIKKDEAGYMQGLAKDTAAFNQALNKDTAAYGSGIRKDEAAFTQGLNKDTAQFNQSLAKDTASF